MSSTDGTQRAGVVLARWGAETALLRLDDGTTLEAPVPPELREAFDVGDAVAVELEGGRLVSWRLA